jgi:hypothetical protein
LYVAYRLRTLQARPEGALDATKGGVVHAQPFFERVGAGHIGGCRLAGDVLPDDVLDRESIPEMLRTADAAASSECQGGPQRVGENVGLPFDNVRPRCHIKRAPRPTGVVLRQTRA